MSVTQCLSHYIAIWTRHATSWSGGSRAVKHSIGAVACKMYENMTQCLLMNLHTAVSTIARVISCQWQVYARTTAAAISGHQHSSSLVLLLIIEMCSAVCSYGSVSTSVWHRTPHPTHFPPLSSTNARTRTDWAYYTSHTGRLQVHGI